MIRSRLSRFIQCLVLALALILGTAPVHAQGGTTNTVAFNGVSFSYDSALGNRVSIAQVPGDPVDLQAPGGPDAAHTEFILYTADATSNTIPATFDAPISVRIYKTADLAAYEYAKKQSTDLTTLLAARPDLAKYMAVSQNQSENALPFLPSLPAAQVIRARAHYVETPTVKGIAYVTVFRQDASPFTASEFMYTFQGLSADGKTYISAIFRVKASVFPEKLESVDMDKFMANIQPYFTDSIQKLNQAAPTDFAPALTPLDALIASLAVG